MFIQFYIVCLNLALSIFTRYTVYFLCLFKMRHISVHYPGGNLGYLRCTEGVHEQNAQFLQSFNSNLK